MKKILIGGAAIVASLAFAAPFARAQFDTPAVQPTLESDADVVLQDSVKHALDSDKRLQGALVTVTVYQGRVEVSGEILDESQSGEIVRVAHKAAPGHQVNTFLDTFAGG
jgi:osmotically-inducible protein OsmY